MDILKKIDYYLNEASKFDKLDIDNEKDMKYALQVAVDDLNDGLSTLLKNTLEDPSVNFAVSKFGKRNEVNAVIKAIEDVKKLSIKIKAK